MKNRTCGDYSNIPFQSLVFFLTATFLLTWGILGFYMFLPEKMTQIFGQLTGNHPLFFLAVYSPAISAFIIVVYYKGITGFRDYLKRIFIWRCSVLWYLFLIIGIPLIFYTGALWKGNLFNTAFAFDSFNSLLTALLLAAIKGPVEEFGWRGFLQPLFQRKISPVWTGIIIGIIWGFWHLPAFLLSGTEQSTWSFAPFFAGTIAISLIMTQLFNSSGGSILLAGLMHFQLMNPIWPDAQPYDTYILALFAIVLIFVKRKDMFSRQSGVKDILIAN